MMGNTAPTITSKISAIRYWHVISGYPDFSVGGGRFRHVLKGLRREHKVKRKLPVTFEILDWIYHEYWQGDASTLRTEVMAAILIGFFFLLRISEVEQLTWGHVTLSTDVEDEQTITVEIAKSKTDQYNDGDVKVLKSMNHHLCPVRMFANWIRVGRGSKEDDKLMFSSTLRGRITSLFRMAGSACNIDGSRMGTHSMRSGGASAMFAAGYETEVIKRWGRWLSGTFQRYLWRDQLIMSTIGRGMIPPVIRPILHPNNGRAGGKPSKGKGDARPNKRLSDISHALVRLLRHRIIPEKQNDGFVPVAILLGMHELREATTSLHDVEMIVNGAGGNWKFRYEFGRMKDGTTLAIRATQGHSLNSGVDDDVLPIAEDVYYVGHATTREAADKIVLTGLNRQQRNHVHFYECNRYGHLLSGMVSKKAEVLIVVSASHARQDGINFYRSSNNVILSSGRAGVIEPKYFRYVYQLPRLNVIWQRSEEEETDGQTGQTPAALPSSYGFDKWFDDYNLFSDSEEPGVFDKSEDDSPSKSVEQKITERAQPSEKSTIKLTPRREPVNPLFLRPRGGSPASSDGGSKHRRSRSPPVSTAVSTITRPAYGVEPLLKKKTGGSEERGRSPHPSVLTRPRRYSPYNRNRSSNPPSEEGGSRIGGETESILGRVKEESELETLIETGDLDTQTNKDRSTKRRIEAGVQTDASPTGKRLCSEELEKRLLDLVELRRVNPKDYYRSDGPGAPSRSSGIPTPPNLRGWGPDYPGSSADITVNTGWGQMSPGWNQSATGFRTPLADVMTTQWAQFPHSMPISPVSTTRIAPVQTNTSNPIRNVPGQGAYEGKWNTPVAQPEPKRKAKTLTDRRTHGARVVAAVDAFNLWKRLDEENPIGPEDPTEGYSEEAMELALRGRNMVQLAVETTPAAAHAKWRSKLRTHAKHGGTEDQLWEEYRVAVRNYKRRRQEALQ